MSYGILITKIKKKNFFGKILEKGHTHMDVDCIHQKIEMRLKGRRINHPLDYEDVIKEARKSPSRYEVETLDYTFFKDFKNSCHLKSIRPGSKSNDPEVTDLKQIKYTPAWEIKLKLEHKGEWMKNPHRSNDMLRVEPIQLLRAAE